MKNKLIIVGGFLGAGKTSLLWEISKRAEMKGESVGLITNDQASELVDTAFLEANENLVSEVSGSCFCCNFNGFADAIKYIREKDNESIIIAEPVGSCTDLSATLMQPLKEKYSDIIDLAPLTVLADPSKINEILDGDNSPAAYIVSKQFEEADVILINKSDLLSSEELSKLKKRASKKWANTVVLSASVKTGEGLDEWFDIIMAMDEPGKKIADVDYDIYAEGEAAFGWLNASFLIKSAENFDEMSSELINRFSKRFEGIGANVGHVKFLLQTKENLIIANLTGNKQTVSLRKLDKKSEKTILTVNARVETTPENLEKIILEEMEKTLGNEKYETIELKCLIPGRPNPTFRYNKVISSESKL